VVVWWWCGGGVVVFVVIIAGFVGISQVLNLVNQGSICSIAYKKQCDEWQGTLANF